jgi:hypothetical protein
MGRLLVDSTDGHRALDLFPNSLLAIAIALGFVDTILAMLLGAWLYKERA